MKELICKNCGSTEFTQKENKNICNYCHSEYEIKGYKPYDPILERQKLALQRQKEDNQGIKNMMPLLILIVILCVLGLIFGGFMGAFQ